jgi:hypothetical protein
MWGVIFISEHSNRNTPPEERNYLSRWFPFSVINQFYIAILEKRTLKNVLNREQDLIFCKYDCIIFYEKLLGREVENGNSFCSWVGYMHIRIFAFDVWGSFYLHSLDIDNCRFYYCNSYLGSLPSEISKKN